MKTRFNYVSNSSSSSFLIAYKDIDEDFKKFNQFDGYKEFISDLSKSTRDDAVECISGILDKCISGVIEQSLDSLFGRNIVDVPRGFREYYSLLFSYHLNCSGLFDKVDEIIERAKTYLDDRIKEGNAIEDWTTEYLKAREALGADSIDCDGIAESACAFLEQSGWKVGAIEYSDECGEWYSYMEHEFMPFMAYSPRPAFNINVISNH